MPELPEVETIVRGLQPAVGRKIIAVKVLDPRLVVSSGELIGARIEAIERRGKYILIALSTGVLVVHLRMSGQLMLTDDTDDRRHMRFMLALDSGAIRFVNPRRLGTVEFSHDGFMHKLGIEPLNPKFTAAQLQAIIGNSRAPIKSIIMDQRRIAGIGNIYASEALWRAKIDPRRSGNTITSDEVKRLHTAIRSVLRDAIDNMGTTISDYRTASGDNGEFQELLAVYGREDALCPECRERILRIKQAGRSTYLCPGCQR